MKEITRSQLECFSELVLGFINMEAEIRENYSGRAMFGRQCLGVVVSDSDDLPKIAIALAMALEIPEDAMNSVSFTAPELLELVTTMPGMVTDNMGHDIIAYWPSISVEAEDEEDNE